MNTSACLGGYHLKTSPLKRYFWPALCGLLLIMLYFPTLREMSEDWTLNDYSHGFLIPLLSIYVVWSRRGQFHDRSFSPDKKGLLIFLLGLGILTLGHTGGEKFLERFSFPLTLLGIVYYLYGVPAAKLSLFPIGYLYLMIPLPYIIFRDVALQLRLLDARAVATIVSLFGVPVLCENYVLHLPEISLEIADGCSGAYSTIALIALGIFYIHFSRRPYKLVLWLMLIPIAISANIIRISLITIVCHYSGDWVLQSTEHQLSGIFNFLVGFGTLILLNSFLEKLPLTGIKKT